MRAADGRAERRLGGLAGLIQRRINQWSPAPANPTNNSQGARPPLPIIRIEKRRHPKPPEAGTLGPLRAL